jgi:PIN domain nuclease of toxin-antitoxin system
VRQKLGTFRKNLHIKFVFAKNSNVQSVHHIALQLKQEAAMRGTITAEITVLYNLTNLQNVSLSTAACLSRIYSGQQETLSTCALLHDVQPQINICM